MEGTSPLFRCEDCGEMNGIEGFGPGMKVNFVGMALACWNCDGTIPLEGYVDFATGYFQGLRRRDVTAVRQFQEVAQAAVAGEITPSEAVRQSAEIDAAFGYWIGIVLKYGLPAISTLLLPILTLYLAVKIAQGDDVDAERMFQQQLQQNQTQELILEELRRSNEMRAAPPRPAPPRPAPPRPMPLPNHTLPSGDVRQNRHARRREASGRRRRPS